MSLPQELILPPMERNGIASTDPSALRKISSRGALRAAAEDHREEDHEHEEDGEEGNHGERREVVQRAQLVRGDLKKQG